MRTIFTLTLSLVFALAAMAQPPEGVNYQAVARDGSGNLLANQNVTVQFSIREGSATGTDVYVETHTTTTNDYGLFSLVIGNGTASTGTFSAIPWGTNDYFLNVEVNSNDMGTTQLMSVPYSLFADKANSAETVTGDFSSINFTDGSSQSTAAKGPVAWGRINANGTVASNSSGNFTCTWNSTSNRYEITFNNFTYDYLFNYPFFTPFATSSFYVSSGSVGSAMTVYIHNSSGTLVQQAFFFIVY